MEFGQVQINHEGQISPVISIPMASFMKKQGRVSSDLKAKTSATEGKFDVCRPRLEFDQENKNLVEHYFS